MSSLTSYLAKKGVVDSAMLQKALLNQAIRGGSPSMNLLEIGAIDERTLIEMICKFHRLSPVTTAECLGADPEMARLIPKSRSEKLGITAIRRDGSTLVVACVEPPHRTEQLLLERDVGKFKLVAASPVAVALSCALHHGSNLDPRAARLALDAGEESLGLGSLPADVAARVRDLLARSASKEMAQPPGAGPAPAAEEQEEGGWEDDVEEVAEEPRPRESIVGKYIIINRIGARPRRPSFRPSALPPRQEPAAPERVELEQAPLSTDITFTDGSLKASEDSRPRRPSSPPPAPREPAPRARADSRPPAVLTEVLDDYLSEKRSAPSPVRVGPYVHPVATPREPMARASRPPEAPPAPVTVVRPISVAGAPRPAGGDAREEASSAGAAVMEAIRKSPAEVVPGYPVEVDRLLSLPEVLEAIETTDRASDITDVVQRFALQYFDVVLVLRYRKGRFEVSAACSRGWAWPVEKLPVRVMGYDQLPETIRKMGQPYLGPLETGGRMAEILASLGRPLSPSAIMFPIAIKGRAVVVIYGDNGERPCSFEEVNDLFHATWVATNRLLALLEERKR